MTRPGAECGTDSGYKAHLRRSEPVDPACLEAHNAQSRRVRAGVHMTATRAALAELRRRHPREYDALYAAARHSIAHPPTPPAEVTP